MPVDTTSVCPGQWAPSVSGFQGHNNIRGKFLEAEL